MLFSCLSARWGRSCYRERRPWGFISGARSIFDAQSLVAFALSGGLLFRAKHLLFEAYRAANLIPHAMPRLRSGPAWTADIWHPSADARSVEECV